MGNQHDSRKCHSFIFFFHYATKATMRYTAVFSKTILSHAFFIQNRIYKFLVTYEDNSTEIFTAEEGTKLYNKLILYIDKGGNSQPVVSKRSSADEILKYKNLLDAGAITPEEYDQKKKKLLEE